MKRSRAQRRWGVVAVCMVVGMGELAAQTTTEFFVDFGTAQHRTEVAGGRRWNGVEPGVSSVELLDGMGVQTAVRLEVVSGFLGANSAGTTTTQAGSPYAQLGFPTSVTRDVMFGGNGSTVVLRFEGLDPDALHDFTFTASRLGVGDVRTADYGVRGFNAGTEVLDASNNTSQIAQVDGVLPDGSGAIELRIGASSSNTNPNDALLLSRRPTDRRGVDWGSARQCSALDSRCWRRRGGSEDRISNCR